MGRRAQLKLFLLVVMVGFVLGLLSILLGTPSTASPRGTPTVPAGTGQITILLLGVDHFDQPPALRAIWFATFRPPGRSVFLYGLPTNAPIAGEAIVALDDLFAWSPEAGVDPLFLSMLARSVPLQPNATVLMDQTAFAALIDYLGGVELNGTTFSGNEVLGFLSLVSEEPDAALASQSRLVEAMLDRLPALGETPDVTPLLTLVPQHAHLSLPASQLLDLVSPLLPVNPAEVHVDRWSPGTTP